MHSAVPSLIQHQSVPWGSGKSMSTSPAQPSGAFSPPSLKRTKSLMWTQKPSLSCSSRSRPPSMSVLSTPGPDNLDAHRQPLVVHHLTSSRELLLGWGARAPLPREVCGSQVRRRTSLSLSGRRSSWRRQLSGSPRWWFISRLRRSRSHNRRSLLINRDALLSPRRSRSKMSVSG